jgi:hypothetical protein
MSLKIFISSVDAELHNERQALHQEIQKLQDLFIGMELFGSDPSRPADYCVSKVQESDLYVGLFGEDYGSIDEATGLSFTQLEYEATSDRVPCLIYFKESISDSAASDPRFSALKNKLRTRHIVYPFKNTNDLKLQFLIDLIKLLRSELFEKIVPLKRGAIPAGALLSLSQGFIREQIKSVGQDKYIADVYVAREAEKEIAGFTNFEERFKLRATAILAHLQSISMQYDLGPDAELAVSRARITLLKELNSENARSVLEELKRNFFFHKVEDAIERVNSVILEESNERFLVSVRTLESWLGEQPFVDPARLSEAADRISHERFRSSTNRALQTDLTYRGLLQLFPAYVEDKRTYLANDLLKDLGREIDRGLKRCLVIVDKAGTGKTNVACRLADQLVGQHPVVLLSGQMELESEYDIEFHIQQKLESAFSGIFSDWMNRVSPSLQEAGKWLFIIIDGINENNRRPLLIRLLKELLPRLESRRIKLILTCRDLFWDVFRDALIPYLFDKVVSLHEFSETEWEYAVAAYFKKYEVECTLDKDAKDALRNPLLLRFFCEAHQGQHLGRVSNLRLLSVFDLYITRTGKNISERHEFLKPESVLNLLIAVAGNMWELRSTSVTPSALGITPQESSDAASVYNLVLSENIILEQASHSYSTRKSVRFLYDEFMEYMIARSWFDEISESSDKRAITSKLLEEAVESLGTFPPSMGAVLFLDKMLKRDGSVVNEFIMRASTIGTFLLSSQQTSLVYAFESINFANIDDELIAAVQKVEPNVREDLRDRLARVIMGVLKARPDHPYARTYVHQVLEVDDEDKSAQSEAILGQMRREQTIASGKQAKAAPRLPPARYHYSDETRINAIGILVQMKGNIQDYDAIDEGIRKLGRTDLHSALQALEYLDLARDELVYKAVADYLNMSQPEYRIYCAWLMRARYGSEAATCLAQLLVDPETRVHEYTAGLFASRPIERELVAEILWRLDGGQNMKPWHLIHFVRLLGKGSSFNPLGLKETYGSLIVNALTALLNHRQASIRLELYRTLIEYPSFVSLESLRNRMQRDNDVYICALAEKLTPSY